MCSTSGDSISIAHGTASPRVHAGVGSSHRWTEHEQASPKRQQVQPCLAHQWHEPLGLAHPSSRDIHSPERFSRQFRRHDAAVLSVACPLGRMLERVVGGVQFRRVGASLSSLKVREAGPHIEFNLSFNNRPSGGSTGRPALDRSSGTHFLHLTEPPSPGTPLQRFPVGALRSSRNRLALTA